MAEKSRSDWSVKNTRSQQFNSQTVTIAFVKEAVFGEASKRALLSYLMAVASMKYPNQQAVTKKLMALFGANYQVRVQSYGNLNVLLFSLTFVKSERLDPSLVHGMDLEKEALAFLKEMIFDQRFDEKAGFDPAVLKAEKQNLAQAILARTDDKVTVAMDEARQRLFKDKAAQESILGSLEEVNALTLDELQQAYEEMVTTDWRIVDVQGDMSDTFLEKQLATWPKKAVGQDSNTKTLQPRAKRPAVLNRPFSVVFREDFQQAIALAHFKLPNEGETLAAAMVLNAYFGAGPSSLLFREVREKQSLAYHVASRLHWDLGLVTVLAECSLGKGRLVLTLIDEQLESLKQGKIDQGAFDQAKQLVLSGRKKMADSPQESAMEELFRGLTVDFPTASELAAAISAVTIEEIVALAAKLKSINRLVMEKGAAANGQ
ncbi:insulinase family protein [Fructobacillus sp. M1-13]|uniref:Insulinase family protein n=1 Tax=Fructobacillus papyriferae TaxID=2713171 RepID=A0ABS5QN21_9LACO|nr:insulinase family protein [Fructobacillus papyriferae]MBS9334431.1 insulinase family protein [Fructobacillus papyriferae]MCD2158420.1 insulinase family protein [Fructobacillus papyriferae]